MKKLLTILLVFSLVFTVFIPAVSADERTPIIFIRGNGETLYDAEGNELVTGFDNVSIGDDSEGGATDAIVDAAVNILKPFVLEGMLFDKWDNYGRAIYEELAPIFGDVGLDENGNPKNGTGVSKEALDNSVIASNEPYLYWGNSEYNFIYDWRLSPYDHVERLHQYILNIMAATGQSQVSLYARCIGGSLLAAYIDEYGHLGHIKNVMFCEVLSNEATIISKAMSGKIEFDAKLAERYLGQLDFCGNLGVGVGFVFSELLNEIVFASMDYFTQINAADMALDSIELLYERLYEALIPAILHASGLATQVNFWTCVAEDDMDDALNLVFGKPGSELRVKYAGLIAKITRYRENISSDLTAFYDKAKANGIHIGFVGKYGFLNAPFTEDADLLSDSLVSLEHATMGATAAKIGQVLSDSYINGRIAEDAENAKYISPDKMVDLSTAYSPETTWVIKNAHHDTFEPVRAIVFNFLNGTEMTVDTVTRGTQFMVYSYETGKLATMTEENAVDYEFMDIPEENPTIKTIFAAFTRFWKMVFDMIKRIFSGNFDMGSLIG